jgi:hypothetical protein
MALGAILVIGLSGAGPVTAYPLPTGSTWKCTDRAAGYYGTGLYWNKNGAQKGRAYWGNLDWQMCVIKTSSGLRYAKVQLSAPDDVYDYKLFTGAVRVWLEGCHAATLHSEAWYESLTPVGYDAWGGNPNYNDPDRRGYDKGYLSGGSWNFEPVRTDSTSRTAPNGYRVHIRTNEAFAVNNGSISPYFVALSNDDGLEEAHFYTGCFSI